MTDDHSNDAVLRLLLMLAERLGSFLEGDETALETLGESIEQGEFSPDEVQAAVLVLRSLGGAPSAAEWISIAATPGKHAQRVLSAQERDLLTPEAWGYLLGLRRNGSLDSTQFERVLDLLTGCGVRPVGVDLACDIATRVALKFDETEGGGEIRHGDFDLTH
jgi:uncharacterized protein Smg (DUF494 family)